MLKLLLILFVLVSLCVVIHGLGMIVGLRWLATTRPNLHHHHFSLPAMLWILVRVVYGLLMLHLLQIFVWAACYQWNGCFPDFATSFYYSATSYSTVGYGDVNPSGNLRILGAVEAVTGILMFGWSTGVLFAVVNRLQGRFTEIKQGRNHFLTVQVKEENVIISRPTFRRLGHAIAVFLKSPVGGRAKALLASLFLLMLCINAMNVGNSFVGRHFMSAIERQDYDGFVYFAWMYVAVFAGSTFVGVMFRFTEERLGLLWRDFLTRRIVTFYMDHALYQNLARGGSISNPDQRMTEDVRQLTTTTLSFILMVTNGTMTVLSFSGVLWTISPKLFLVAVLYALMGSALTIWLGRPLIKLNYRQSDREADFRSNLIWTHEHADEVARDGIQAATRDRLLARVDDLVGNFRRIVSVNRNLSFFTTGYNYLIQLIPVIIVAPLFISGQVEFGVIGQAAMAFATLLGAFSLVITQFQAISAYASVVLRLGEFMEAAEKCAAEESAA